MQYNILAVLVLIAATLGCARLPTVLVSPSGDDLRGEPTGHTVRDMTVQQSPTVTVHTNPPAVEPEPATLRVVPGQPIRVPVTSCAALRFRAVLEVGSSRRVLENARRVLAEDPVDLGDDALGGFDGNVHGKLTLEALDVPCEPVVVVVASETWSIDVPRVVSPGAWTTPVRVVGTAPPKGVVFFGLRGHSFFGLRDGADFALELGDAGAKRTFGQANLASVVSAAAKQHWLLPGREFQLVFCASTSDQASFEAFDNAACRFAFFTVQDQADAPSEPVEQEIDWLSPHGLSAGAVQLPRLAAYELTFNPRTTGLARLLSSRSSAVVDLYVVADRAWAAGDAIGQVHAKVEKTLVASCANANYTILDGGLPEGEFDLVVDTNRNAILDAGDLVNGLAGPGFVVTGETLVDPRVARAAARVTALRRRNLHVAMVAFEASVRVVVAAEPEPDAYPVGWLDAQSGWQDLADAVRELRYHEGRDGLALYDIKVLAKSDAIDVSPNGLPLAEEVVATQVGGKTLGEICGVDAKVTNAQLACLRREVFRVYLKDTLGGPVVDGLQFDSEWFSTEIGPGYRNVEIEVTVRSR